MLNKKFMGWRALGRTLGLSAGLLAQGQTNFVKMLWKFNRVYNHRRQVADHRREVRYPMQSPQAPLKKIEPAALYIHPQSLARNAGPPSGPS